MERKSNELSAMYNNCIKETKEEIKKILRANNNKVTWDSDNDVYVIGMCRHCGEVDTIWVRGLVLVGDNIRLLVRGENYFDGEPISCDWLDILEEIENTLEYQQQNK